MVAPRYRIGAEAAPRASGTRGIDQLFDLLVEDYNFRSERALTTRSTESMRTCAFFRGDEVSGNQQNHAAAVSLRQKAEPATVKNNTPRVGAQCCHTSLGLTSGCRHFHLPAGESESFWRPSLVAAGITDGCEGGVRALTTPPDLFQQLVPVKFRLIDDNYSRFNNLAARAGFEPLWH